MIATLALFNEINAYVDVARIKEYQRVITIAMKARLTRYIRERRKRHTDERKECLSLK